MQRIADGNVGLRSADLRRDRLSGNPSRFTARFDATSSSPRSTRVSAYPTPPDSRRADSRLTETSCFTCNGRRGCPCSCRCRRLSCSASRRRRASSPSTSSGLASAPSKRLLELEADALPNLRTRRRRGRTCASLPRYLCRRSSPPRRFARERREAAWPHLDEGHREELFAMGRGEAGET